MAPHQILARAATVARDVRQETRASTWQLPVGPTKDTVPGFMPAGCGACPHRTQPNRRRSRQAPQPCGCPRPNDPTGNRILCSHSHAAAAVSYLPAWHDAACSLHSTEDLVPRTPCEPPPHQRRYIYGCRPELELSITSTFHHLHASRLAPPPQVLSLSPAVRRRRTQADIDWDGARS